MDLIDWLFAGVEGRLSAKLDNLLAAVTAGRTELEERIMASMQDLLDKVAALKTVDDSLSAAVDGIIARETDILAQLQAALAAGADPAQIQAVADALDANIAETTANRDKLVAAAQQTSGPAPQAVIP